VGCRFVPQGRSPDSGVDCVGLICLAFGIQTDKVPRTYRLRGASREAVEAGLEPVFRRVAARRARPGDVLLCRVSRDQLHLMLLSERGFIHADAMLRRVVETPGAAPWPVIGAYRRRTRSKRKS